MDGLTRPVRRVPGSLWLFVLPSSVGWWPWTLTPVVAQAMAAWLLGLGVVLATAARENDLERIRIATASYVVLGALQLVAAARYASNLRSSAACVPYFAFLVLLVATGVVGVALGRRSP